MSGQHKGPNSGRHWFSIKGRLSRAQRRASRHAFRLQLEHLEDRRLLAVDLLSATPELLTDSGASINPAITADGRFVVFQSFSESLVSIDGNTSEDVFVRDRDADRDGIFDELDQAGAVTTTLISVNAAGTASGTGPSLFRGASVNASISDSGRYVVFVSYATDLVAGADINETPNVYVRDRDTDGNGIFDEPGAATTFLVSVDRDSASVSGAGRSGGPPAAPFVGPTGPQRPVISADGSTVAFVSGAPDVLLADESLEDLNGTTTLDVFKVAVENAGKPVLLVSQNFMGTGTGMTVLAASANPSISASGGLVAFQSTQPNLVNPLTLPNPFQDVFIGSGTSVPELVSVNLERTGGGDGMSFEPVISRDGRHVAFFSAATNLVESDGNGELDVFVRDLKSRRTSLVSMSRVAPDGGGGNDASPPSISGSKYSAGPTISGNGRFVAYTSDATDLLLASDGVTDGNGDADVYVLDRDSDGNGQFDELGRTRTQLVSVNVTGTASGTSSSAGLGSRAPVISADGRYIAFVSSAMDLVVGGTLGGDNVYLRDLVDGTTMLLSTSIAPVQGDVGGDGASGVVGLGTGPIALAASVPRVAFSSLATDLDTDTTDSNSNIDIYAFTPSPDIRTTSFRTGGTITGLGVLRVLFEPVGPYDVGVYRSEDADLDTGDDLLATTTFLNDTGPAESIAASLLDFTIGSIGEPDVFPFPGTAEDELDESTDDYFILLAADPLNEIDEFDVDPLNEDNTIALSGVYHLPGGSVFVHGRELPTADRSSESISVTTTATEFIVRMSGSIRGTLTYDLTDVTGIRVRSHSGDDRVIGSPLPDFIHGGPGGDYLDGAAGDDWLNGGDGNDILIGGPGKDTIFDGCGDDLVFAGPEDDVVMSTPCSDDIFIDGGGSDTIDFSLDDLPITLDLDSTAVQAVDADSNTLQLIGDWENFVGSPFDDQLTLRPLPDPRTIDGGAGNDRLIIDAKGNLVVNDGTKFSFPGTSLGDIFYSGFEDIRITNAAKRIIDDGDTGYSAPGFNSQADGQGFDGDIEFSHANSGNTATWTFNDVAPGVYSVAATWTTAPDRSSNAPFRILEGAEGGSLLAEVLVNQELAPNEFADEGVNWSNLGIVRVTENTLIVELMDVNADSAANDPFEAVIADAIRIEPILSRAPQLPVILDDAPNRTGGGVLTPKIFESTGTNLFTVVPAVIAFQTELGGPDNGDALGSQSSGARQVNWADVGDANATPSFLPPDIFNSTFTRGLQLYTRGDGFQVSGTSTSAQGPRFENLNDTYDTAFGALSADRLFTPIGDNKFDVTFFVPGSDEPATVSGFGAVFTDVDVAFASQMEYFDAAGQQLLTRSVLATPGDASLSFLGVTFEGAPLARVRITAGDAAVLATASPSDITQGGNGDIVALDNFIYGEPIPLTAPVTNGGFTSDCSPVGGEGFLSDQHTCIGEQQAEWDFGSLAPLQPGTYVASATWTGGNNYSTEVRYVYDDGMTMQTATANQQLPPDDFTDAGLPWERLMKVEIVDGQTPIITASSGSPNPYDADAIRFDLAPTISVVGVDLGFTYSIPDGGAANTVSDSRDVTPVSSPRNVYRFGVTNDGAAPLVLERIGISGDGFMIDTSQTALEIPARGKTFFDVDFAPVSLGLFDGVITLSTNDFEHPIFMFDVAVEVVDDTTPPTVQIIRPNDGASFVEGTTIPILVDAGDDIRLRSVELLIDNRVFATLDEAPFEFDVELPIGVTSTEIGASARDFAGNVTVAPLITLELVVELPPLVDILSPLEGQGVLSNDTINVDVQPINDVEISQVEILVDDVIQKTRTFEPFFDSLVIPNRAGDVDIEVRVTDTRGNTTSQSVNVTAFNSPLIGANSIVTAPDAGAPPLVKIFQPDGTESFRFFAFDANFLGGVRVATGDINNDGAPDIITGAGPGGGPHVKVFDGSNGTEFRSFFAFEPTFTGGVFVGSGDVNGDGTDDIVVGAGVGNAGPHVKVFSGLDNQLLSGFFAFDGFTGGVRVAVGDINGDGQSDIITGAGPGGGPHIKIFDGHRATRFPETGDVSREQGLLSDFFAFPESSGGPTFFAGNADMIFVGADRELGESPDVRVFDSNRILDSQNPDRALESELFAFTPPLGGGIRVGSTDIDGDGRNDIIVGTGPGTETQVKLLNAIGENLGGFIPYPDFTGGVFVAGVNRATNRVFRLPETGGTNQIEVDGDDLVVRDESGTELSRQTADPSTTVRIVGADDIDDLAIIRTLGQLGPKLIFDGGHGGNDAIRVDMGSASHPTLEYLRVTFNHLLITSFATNRNSTANDFNVRAIDLEPIEDNARVMDRQFDFAGSNDIVSFDTGLDQADSILRINSDNSEVVDFLTQLGTLTVNLGAGSDEFRFDLTIDQLPTLDGQDGNDSLVLVGSGHHLDLTDPALNRLFNMELIDIVGASPNELTLDGQSVIAATDSNDTLIVRHDEDDTVNYAGEGWKVAAPVFVDGSQRHVLLNNSIARVETINTLPWQNPLESTDVNFSGKTTAFDALLIINLLFRSNDISVDLATPTSASELPDFYYDVNRNHSASATDALDVIFFLNQMHITGEPEFASEGNSAIASTSVRPIPTDFIKRAGLPVVRTPDDDTRQTPLAQDQALGLVMGESLPAGEIEAPTESFAEDKIADDESKADAIDAALVDLFLAHHL